MFINCERAQITGVSYNGGYAEYVVVPHEAVARLPDGLDAIHAGPLLCAGVTTFNALRNSGARPGDTVAVQGIGGLGHLGIQYAARMGFRTVAISRGPDKAKLAAELGAHEYIDTVYTSRDRARQDHANVNGEITVVHAEIGMVHAEIT
jgi:alcohol dehydrogenase, propanol-preferring